MTASFTHTYTKARIQVIVAEYTYLLLRAGLDESHAESIAEGIRRRFVQRVTMYATDAEGFTHGEVQLSLDWDRHDRFIADGKVTVTIDAELWKEDASPDVRLAVRTLREFIAGSGLEMGVEIGLTPEVMADRAKEVEADELMNLVASPDRPWAGEPVSFGGEIEETPELRVDTRLSDK